MRSLLTFVMLVGLAASPALAQETHCYGWEDGGVVLGAYLPDNMYLANTDAQAYEGSYSLEVVEIAGSSTPQAYVAWITGLQEGDEITATIQTLDLITGNPSLRIWGHWTTAGGTIDDYAGSASGNGTYSGGEGWVELGYTWIAGASQIGGGLVVEIRPYNASPWEGTNWVDYLCVTAPDHVTIYFPGGTVGNEDTSLSGVKALFR
jgi:hypothetical protein